MIALGGSGRLCASTAGQLTEAHGTGPGARRRLQVAAVTPRVSLVLDPWALFRAASVHAQVCASTGQTLTGTPGRGQPAAPALEGVTAWHLHSPRPGPVAARSQGTVSWSHVASCVPASAGLRQHQAAPPGDPAGRIFRTECAAWPTGDGPGPSGPRPVEGSGEAAAAGGLRSARTAAISAVLLPGGLSTPAPRTPSAHALRARAPLRGWDTAVSLAGSEGRVGTGQQGRKPPPSHGSPRGLKPVPPPPPPLLHFFFF